MKAVRRRQPRAARSPGSALRPQPGSSASARALLPRPLLAPAIFASCAYSRSSPQQCAAPRRRRADDRGCPLCVCRLRRRGRRRRRADVGSRRPATRPPTEPTTAATVVPRRAVVRQRWRWRNGDGGGDDGGDGDGGNLNVQTGAIKSTTAPLPRLRVRSRVRAITAAHATAMDPCDAERSATRRAGSTADGGPIARRAVAVRQVAVRCRARPASYGGPLDFRSIRYAGAAASTVPDGPSDPQAGTPADASDRRRLGDPPSVGLVPRTLCTASVVPSTRSSQIFAASGRAA